ncbi:MAG: hypothetical protein WD066_19800 [Planctomycetaceae bacterium]
MRIPKSLSLRFLVSAALLGLAAESALAQRLVVPGTGQRDERYGDDFEDEEWTYHTNLPKASREQDGQTRDPLGYSANGKWKESPKRGTPEIVERVAPPAGGLPGSTGALSMRSQYAGIPNRPMRDGGQDDLIFNGSYVSVNRSPNVVVRVFVPPFEEWEKRTGTSFGFRISATTMITEKKPGLRIFGGGTQKKSETYYPGLFIQYNARDARNPQESAVLVIRGQDSGHDYAGPPITPGWWTLGMSVTPDGRFHYFARPGVENLRPQDHVASHSPYGYRALHINSYFFNVCNGDTGQWSTPWIIDDPCLHYGDTAANPPQQAFGPGGIRR